MVKLQTGKMTGKQLAEWLGITYGAYKNSVKKHQDKLYGYCKWTQIRGGVEISEVYIDTYRGDLSKLNVETYDKIINELMERNHSTCVYSSIAGMVRKLKNEQKEKYGNMKDRTLWDQLDKAATVLYGKNQVDPDPNLGGTKGYRELTWGIRLNKFNEYRGLTKEEWKIFRDIVSKVYMREPDKIIKDELLQKQLKNGSIDVEEYFKEKERLGLDNFRDCLTEFTIETGYELVRCSRHQLRECGADR